jgi:hypothetical protein
MDTCHPAGHYVYLILLDTLLMSTSVKHLFYTQPLIDNVQYKGPPVQEQGVSIWSEGDSVPMSGVAYKEVAAAIAGAAFGCCGLDADDKWKMMRNGKLRLGCGQ